MSANVHGLSAGEFVGVIPPSAFHTLGYPKQLLLMFEKIAIDLGHKGFTSVHSKDNPSALNEFQYLADTGLLTTVTGLLAKRGIRSTRSVKIIGTELIGGILENQRGALQRFAHLSTIARPSLRVVASDLRKKYGIDAVAVSPTGQDISRDEVADRDAVVRLTLKQFPVPSDVTPWDSVLAFRSNADSREKFFRLKRWINKVAREGIKVYEVDDELKTLLHEYKREMEFHEMRHKVGTVEVVLTTTAEVLENLLKIKLSKAASAFFSVTRENTKLSEEERSAIGREVAYIVSAHERFQ